MLSAQTAVPRAKKKTRLGLLLAICHFLLSLLSSCMASALTRTTFKHSSKLNMPEKQIALYLVRATDSAAQGWLMLHQFCGIALKQGQQCLKPHTTNDSLHLFFWDLFLLNSVISIQKSIERRSDMQTSGRAEGTHPMRDLQLQSSVLRPPASPSAASPTEYSEWS